MEMQLQPRHTKIVELLNSNPKRRYGVDELARVLNLSLAVLRNELPTLANGGYVSRRAVGRTFEYYSAKNDRPLPQPISAELIKPLDNNGLLGLLDAIATKDYTPILTKQGWKMSYAVAHLVAGHSDPAIRKELEEFLQTVEATALTCRRLLSTPQLWDERLSAWLREGMTENQLEIFARLASKALELHGRLEPSKQSPDNNLRNSIDYH